MNDAEERADHYREIFNKIDTSKDYMVDQKEIDEYNEANDPDVPFELKEDEKLNTE